jgi:gp16 family phage-associated protein
MCSELTPEDVKRRFEQAGETISGWAGKHGFPKDAVYAILNGRIRGKRGQAHSIAVALGLKCPPSSNS